MSTTNNPHSVSIIAEYVWIGGKGDDIRSKSRTIVCDDGWDCLTVDNLPIWNYDGSSTCQASGDDSEVMLHPVRVFADPFRGAPHILVMCEAKLPNGEPALCNERAWARTVFENPDVVKEETWFGLEQEYTLFEKDGKTPLGWPENGYPAPQGPYYCSVGYGNAPGRSVMEEHYQACLGAGIIISGTNAEVMKGQWEYQIGPCTGLESGDHMWMSRYMLYRVCENQEVVVTLDPKPMSGDWNGAGCHTNYSTKSMREGVPGSIEKALHGLAETHDEHIKVYGEGNERRMTGLHETSTMTDFSFGVANRGCSIRIPRDTAKAGKGYIEDRRPASNIDPYLVTAKVTDTCLVRDFGTPPFTLTSDLYYKK